jgi:hypothetical protein
VPGGGVAGDQAPALPPEQLALHRCRRARQWLAARNVLGWPKRCKLAHAFLWEYIYKGLECAQLLCQLYSYESSTCVH